MAHEVFTRHPSNPVLSAADVPYPASLVFNAGITKFHGKYVMVFRNDYGANNAAEFQAGGLKGTNIGLATSDDGVKWTVSPKPCFAMGDKSNPNEEIRRAYDPRLTVIDGRCYMCFAVDTKHGICGGVAVTDDFDKWQVLSISAPDNRNMVLFPAKIGGRFARLERPFPIYGRGKPEAFDCWYADSPDCRYWGNNQLVLGSDHVPYCNNKIGPAAPPIKTKRGWLATIHAVRKDENQPLKSWDKWSWCKRYMAGLILLDLDEPWKVIGMAPQPVLDPSDAYPYEVDGFRGSVIFPGGMLLEDDGQVKLYYGASDTVECLATAHVDDLLAIIEPFTPPHRR